MDDDLQKLETELMRLRPAAPTRDFLARMERELSVPVARRPAPRWWLWAGALPAAAAFAVLLTFAGRNWPSADANRGPVAQSAPAIPMPVLPAPSPAATSPEMPAAFKPIAAENVLYSARDEGLVTLEDGTPARRERFNYVDTIVWKNPRTNASVRWTVPREEVRVVPVKFQ
jgi:hypothetical protein